MNVISKNFTCNESIRERELRVIDSDGSQLGIISRNEALQMAEERDLDLVMISPTAVPPVCKIMDLGKYIYEQAKKEKEAKKKQKVTVIKEIRCGITIEENDIVIKAKNARKFLQDGNKVKITVRFRGRELNYVKAGEETLNEFIENLSDIATVEKKPLLEGKNMFVILAKKVEK